MTEVPWRWQQRVCVLWLISVSVATGQGGNQPTTEARERCEFDVPAAVNLAESILAGSQKPNEKAQSLLSLGRGCYDRGRYSVGEPLLRKGIRLQEETLGPEHKDLAASLNSLAMLVAGEGNTAEAESLYRRALANCEKEVGPEHADTAAVLNNLGVLLFRKKDYAAAEPLYRRALAIREKVLGPEDPNTAASLQNLEGPIQASLSFGPSSPLERVPTVSGSKSGTEGVGRQCRQRLASSRRGRGPRGPWRAEKPVGPH